MDAMIPFPRHKLRLVLAGVVLFNIPGLGALAQGTDNNELLAVPPPSKVVVDGDLSDWDLSGKIVVCRDVATLLGKYSADVAMMYDADALYVGVDWNDPTPLVNNYDPRFDVDRRKCFHSDSLQIHFRTDQERKVIGWYYAKGKESAVMVLDGWAPWSPPIVYTDGLKELGITQAFVRKPDGSGYVQEMRIPWTAVVKSGKAYQADDAFDCMLDLVWGPDSGKGWPINHMMDLCKEGSVHTGWFWEVDRIYGKVKLSPAGKLTLPRPAFLAAVAKPEAPVALLPIRFDLPTKDGVYFTVAINDEEGNRIRNLVADVRVRDYLVKGKRRTVEVVWDGLDDRGHVVPAGTYHVAGLTRGELKASFEASFYNPGTPPWETADGCGSWGADHSPPGFVAAAGDGVVIGWWGAEGGSGMIGVGPDGLKKWGEHQGTSAMAADGESAYFMLSDGWAGKYGLARLNRSTGAYQPFERDGKLHYPLAPDVVFGGTPPGNVVGIAAHGDTLVLTLSSNKLAVLEAATAKLVKMFDVPKPTGLAFNKDGKLYAILDGAVSRVDLEAGTFTAIPLPGLGRITALTTDNDGNILVADMGPDSQVKAFSPAGEPVYTVGKKGGRPLRGTFDEQAMVSVSSITVDSKGQIWAVECWEYPRRVSVWGRDGRLVRDYIGNAAYAGSGIFLHEQDPTLGYVGPVEFKLDKKNHTAKITRVLWVPGPGEGFPVDGQSGQRFTSDVSGKPREYMTCCPAAWGGPMYHVVYMERAGGWQPVAAITNGGFWNDTNRNGKSEPDECTGGGGSVGGGWGVHVGRDLTIYADGVMVYKPVSFTDDGAPVYGPAGMRKLVDDRGDFTPIDGENILAIMSNTGYGGLSYIRGVDTTTGRELWRYPANYHGVHGSHGATMPSPGFVLGVIKALGYARVNDKVGSVVMFRNNLGTDYIMTADGLFVGAMFRDCRLPGPSLPDRPEDIYTFPMEQLSEGGEPFNGWFGKQADGKIRLCNGMVSNAGTVLEIKGLESIVKFRGPKIKMTEALRVKAEVRLTQRPEAKAAVKPYTITKAERPPTIDGDAGDWAKVPAIEITREGFPDKGTVKLSRDAENLYVLYAVTDPSPWLNEGKDFTRLFKTGDAVDLQLGTNTAAGRADAAAGDLRLMLARMGTRAVAVLMKPVDPAAPAAAKIKYHSPVGDRFFDRVELLGDAKVAAKVEDKRYTVEAAIPIKALGIDLSSGTDLRGDVGFIASDAQGLIDVARTYWANKVANIVNDMPTEAWLYPATWGEFRLE